MKKIFIVLFLLVGMASQAQILQPQKGGTGQTTLAKAFKAMLPDTIGHAGDLLGVTKGGGFSWQIVSGGGSFDTSLLSMVVGFYFRKK